MDGINLKKENYDNLSKVINMVNNKYTNIIIKTILTALYTEIINTQYKLNIVTTLYKEKKENLLYLHKSTNLTFDNYPKYSRDVGIDILTPTKEIINATLEVVNATIQIKVYKSTIQALEGQISIYLKKIKKGSLSINQL